MIIHFLILCSDVVSEHPLTWNDWIYYKFVCESLVISQWSCAIVTSKEAIVIWFQFFNRPHNFFNVTDLASLFSLGGYFDKYIHAVLQDCTIEWIFLIYPEYCTLEWIFLIYPEYIIYLRRFWFFEFLSCRQKTRNETKWKLYKFY